MSNKPLTLPLLAAGLAAAVLMLAAPARADDAGDGYHARKHAQRVIRHERREARHERREHRRERREHRRIRRHIHGHRHDAGLIGYTVGATVGYAVGYSAGVHHARPYRYRPACTPVSKITYDSYGRPLRIGGTMCFDRYGVGYIVPGSRYVIG